MIAVAQALTPAGTMFCIALQALLKRLKALEAMPAQEASQERRALVLSCIMQSCAWVEGFANDVCEQSGGNRHKTADWLPNVKNRDLVFFAHRAWDLNLNPRGQNGVERWASLLTQFDLELDRKGDVSKDMALLVRLRNQFIHAEPMMYPAIEPAHIALEKDLTGRFAIDDAPHVGFFPHKVLSTGCATWAFGTARAFCSHVSGLLGMPDPHTPFILALPVLNSD